MTSSPTNIHRTSCPVKLYLDRTLGDFYRTLSDVRLLFCSLICYAKEKDHGLLIEYGHICYIVKLPISMIRPFLLANNSHITLYPQLSGRFRNLYANIGGNMDKSHFIL